MNFPLEELGSIPGTALVAQQRAAGQCCWVLLQVMLSQARCHFPPQYICYVPSVYMTYMSHASCGSRGRTPVLDPARNIKCEQYKTVIYCKVRCSTLFAFLRVLFSCRSAAALCIGNGDIEKEAGAGWQLDHTTDSTG